MFSGTVPALFSDVPKLSDFYVDGNKLTGTIPEGICEKGLNKDFFDKTGTNNENHCEDIACPTNTASSDGIGPCVPCDPGLYTPYLGWDKECMDISEDIILDTFYAHTSRLGWTTPWDANINHCDQPGITCDMQNHVTEINLKGFGLTGTIPEVIGFLEYLRVLDLSDNQLSGHLPSELRFAPLERLDVSGNRLVGVVPLMLCSKPGINGNGGGTKGRNFGCDHIACSVGYAAPQGSHNHSGCTPCPGGGGNYLGSKTCGSGYNWAKDFTYAKAFGVFFGFFTLFGSLLLLLIFISKRISKKTDADIPAATRSAREGMEFERVPANDAEYT